MALNMSDPAAVMAVYSTIVNNENNWLLLHYINENHDELGLHSFGDEGLEEMKTKLSDLNEVYIAFYREERGHNPGYIVINYIPPSISGVKRARALVHSRRVGIIFKKHQTIFTVDNLSFITAENVHQAIKNPDTAFPVNSPVRPTHSQLADTTNKSVHPQQQDILTFDPVPSSPPTPPLQPVRQPYKVSPKPIIANLNMVRRSFSEIYAPHAKVPGPVPPVPPLPKGGSLFTHFLRRKKRTDDSTGGMEEHMPPPTPPKDKGHFNAQAMGFSHSNPIPSRPEQTVRRQRSHSMSDFAVISHAHGSDELVILEPERDSRMQDDHSPMYSLPLRGKWAHESTLLSDPAERARRRHEVQMQREKEEQEVLKEEAERQRQLKLQREKFLRQEQEAEVLRKAEVEQEIRRITLERRRREQLEKEEEERKRQELEERKRRDKERRLEEHRRLEEWRKEQAQKAEAAARQLEENKRKEEVERKKKIQLAETKAKHTKKESEFTGWITLQSADALSWRRRFYKFVGNSVYLYRSPKDMADALETTDLKGKLRGLKEWYEGYEDLEAIAFSFVVEFRDGQEPWSMYADSEEEKYKILGLLRVSAGL
ncbi:hypothetical protein B0H34DRAFT_704656 [Crassisporium funariophilum]|nr:hypothetical protein B0H34DRAFT_704656 [Crassisporium funariophilum]